MSLITMVFSLLALPALAIPGGTVANGGQTVLCETPNKEVQSYESFDLYEGRVVYGHEYSRDVGDPVAKAIELARKLDLAEEGVKTARAEQHSFVTRVKTVAHEMFISDIVLPPTHDSKGYEIILNGCRLVPTINFYNKNSIYAYAQSWNKLYDVDKAALYLHEAVYWHLRQTGVEKDSRRTRKVVSYLMSGRPLESVSAMPKSISSGVQYCSGKGTKFWAYKDAQDKLTLQFVEIGGYLMLTRTTVTTDLKGLPYFPIATTRGSGQMASGEVKSLLDKDMLLQLYWVNDTITLKGQVQDKAYVDARVTCQNL